MRTANLSRAATKACRALLARRVDSLPVDPLSLLRSCRNTAVYTLDALMEAADAHLQDRVSSAFRDADAISCTHEYEGETRYVTVYRADGNPARLRFTLAHELGHRVLRHTGKDPAEEREADCFASYLLCPEPVLQLLASVPDGAVERIATACYVSRSCAKAALRRPQSLVQPSELAQLENLLMPVLENLKTTLL